MVDGTLPTSVRIMRSTVRLRSQPTSLALRMVSPRRCRRQVEKEWPNMKRTKMLVTMQPASTTAVTSTLRVISSTRNDIVSGPPTIATPSVAMPVSMLTMGSTVKPRPVHTSTAAKNFPSRLPTNSEAEEKTAAEARGQRDQAGDQLQRDDGGDEADRHLAVQVEHHRAVAGRQHLRRDDRKPADAKAADHGPEPDRQPFLREHPLEQRGAAHHQDADARRRSAPTRSAPDIARGRRCRRGILPANRARRRDIARSSAPASEAARIGAALATA